MKNPYFGYGKGYGKFKDTDKAYFEYINELEKMDLSSKELIFQFPVYVGHVNLARYLFFYDLYKKVAHLSGHIADVGTYKGASFLFMAKLVKLFEMYNTTQVHGFDWFKGMNPSEKDDINQKGMYQGDYDYLLKMIELQGIQDIAILHKMDITKELAKFKEENPHLRFKMVFIDCGIEEVLEKSLEILWPSLVYGGVLIMDHFNSEVSPTESRIVEKYVGKCHIQQMAFNRQPTCFVIKE